MLMKCEGIMHYYFLKFLIKIQTSFNQRHKYGNENGQQVFLVINALLDSSIYLYEAIKVLSQVSPLSLSQIDSNPQYGNLKVMRNNLHTYSKSGGYQKKALRIIEQKLSEYKMDKPDALYSLRSDISLVFSIENRTRRLIGCDYFISHCIYESDNNNWKGNDYKEFAQSVSGGIAELVSIFGISTFPLPELSTDINTTPIELFDYQSPKLFESVPLDHALVFRLLLVLSQISYGLILVNQLVNINNNATPSVWVCFVTKLLAIKYDESFDNIENMIKYSSQEDRQFIEKWLKTNHLSRKYLLTREFAQSLRNLLHYQIIMKPNNLSEATNTSVLESIYCLNSKVKNYAEFFEMLQTMILECTRLQWSIRELFKLDKLCCF